LDFYHSNGAKSYIDESIIRYTHYKEKSAYKLIWVFAGRLGKQGSRHSFSWSGKQYSNDISTMNLISADAKPDKNGFYLIDLH